MYYQGAAVLQYIDLNPLGVIKIPGTKKKNLKIYKNVKFFL